MSRPLPDTSQTLIVALRGGLDVSADNRFAQAYRLPLQEYAWTRGYASVDVEVAVSDTLRIALRGLTQGLYDPAKGRLRDWLLAILRDHLRQDLQDAAERHRCECAYAADLPASIKPNAVATDAALWRRLCLRQALRILFADPAVQGRHLAVFRAYVLEGRAANDVADAYGLTPDNVYQIRTRLIARLRTLCANLLRGE